MIQVKLCQKHALGATVLQVYACCNSKKLCRKLWEYKYIFISLFVLFHLCRGLCAEPHCGNVLVEMHRDADDNFVCTSNCGNLPDSECQEYSVTYSILACNVLCVHMSFSYLNIPYILNLFMFFFTEQVITLKWIFDMFCPWDTVLQKVQWISESIIYHNENQRFFRSISILLKFPE